MRPKTRLLVILCTAALILIAACVAVVLFQNDKTEPKSPKGFLIDAGELKSVGFAVGKESVKLIKEGSFWYLDGNGDFPLDQEIPSAMQKMLSPLSAQRKVVEDPDDPETYGLGKYALEVDLTGTNGSWKLLIGDPCSAAPGWYFAIGDEKTVYLGDESLGTAFTFGELNDLILLETYPPIGASSVTGVKTKNLDVVLTASEQTSDGEYSVRINDTLFPADAAAAEGLFYSASVLEPERCVRYSQTDEETLAQYGFTGDSIEISYTDSGVEQTCSILIGDQSGDGHIYTLLEGSKQICLVHAEDLEFLSVMTEELLSKTVFPIVPGRLSELKTESPEGEFTLTRITRSVEDADGLTQTVAEYFLDSVTADQDRADELIETLSSFKASSAGVYDPPETDAFFKLTLTFTDGSVCGIEVKESRGEYFVIRDGLCRQKLSETDAEKLGSIAF